ncbi:hypothetical protein PHYPO_G00117450 [Pangasianodon hypophthalmus]|uniref:Transmembrane protein n=1 Tax=Pangasianodon hypophthalmus TaxID=310915 RepID=A0A5N5KZ16_PANHP|nr:hypothetical protein PHYPO_G00117450 [Pangasianodon hypophthalmus]
MAMKRPRPQALTLLAPRFQSSVSSVTRRVEKRFRNKPRPQDLHHHSISRQAVVVVVFFVLFVFVFVIFFLKPFQVDILCNNYLSMLKECKGSPSRCVNIKRNENFVLAREIKLRLTPAKKKINYLLILNAVESFDVSVLCLFFYLSIYFGVTPPL